MKHVKGILFVMAVCACISFANAADVATYTAFASPGADLDGNDGTVDVWTVTGDDGPNRSYLKDSQDGNQNMWTVWDEPGDGGTYATHTFSGGALSVGQSVVIDYSHNNGVESDRSIGIRFLDSGNSEVEFVFTGGGLWFSKYDTATGTYELLDKAYDNYDLFQVTFTLTGPNSYMMTATEGTIADAPGSNGADDGNPDVGPIVDTWTGTFTGTGITGIQVFTEGGSSSDQWFDNLSINWDWLNRAHSPLPSHEQVDVLVSGLELSWAVPQVSEQVVDPALDSFELYINTDPNFNGINPVAVTGWDATTLTASYTPSTELSTNSTYYWRVDSVMTDASVVEGPTWRFDTEITKAIIDDGPDFQVIDAGTTASFSIVVSSETQEVYQWYYDADNDAETADLALVDGGDISGANTATLSIANAEVADEGMYYCIVNNDAFVPVESVRVPLSVKRRIAYWPFDSDLQNAVAGSPATIAVEDPNNLIATVPGIVNNGVEFINGANMLYTDAAEADYFDGCNYAMTVACWVKTTDDQDWAALVARKGEGEGWQLRQSGFTGDRVCFTTRGTGNDDGMWSNRGIYDGQWHYVVGTFDGSEKKVYIDGTLSIHYSGDTGEVSHVADAATAPVNSAAEPVSIGGRVWINEEEGTLDTEVHNNVAGVYDEVEIYNYALDADTIAQTYADVTGTDVCLGLPYDLNDDCTVDLSDFSSLAAEWLNSALVTPSL